MNILHIVSKLDATDGAQDVIASTRYLTLNGHKVVVVSQSGPLVKKIDDVGARHYAVSINPNIFLIPIAIFKLSRIILQENIQVVHARGSLCAFVAFFASRSRERTFITTVYGHYKAGFFRRPQFWARRVICLSRSDMRDLIKGGFVPQGKVAVMPPFIDEHEFLRRNGRPSVPSKEYRGHFMMGAVLPLSLEGATQDFIKVVSIL